MSNTMDTAGGAMGPIMNAKTPADARTAFDAYVSYLRLVQGERLDAARALASANLRYFAGYYGEDTRKRVLGWLAL